MISILKLRILNISSSTVKFDSSMPSEFIGNVACMVKSVKSSNEAPVLGVKGSCNKRFDKASKKPNELIE